MNICKHCYPFGEDNCPECKDERIAVLEAKLEEKQKELERLEPLRPRPCPR